MVAAPAVIAQDPTGPGDTYVGYLVASLSTSTIPDDRISAMSLATQAAGLNGPPGAMESIPWTKEIRHCRTRPVISFPHFRHIALPKGDL